MAHATGGATRAAWQGKRPNSVTKILSMCGGLRIALSVTGSAIAFHVNLYGSFERACEDYSKELELEKKKGGLGDQDTLEGVSLNAGILLSLEYLEFEFLKWKNKYSFFVEHSASELYTSLCVLENQEWISISVLSRLWQLDVGASKAAAELFCGMSLATLEMRSSGGAPCEETGIVLHDLLLDFCYQEAKKANTSAMWHAKLLNGYLEQSGCQEYDASGVSLLKLILRRTPRPWWSEAVADDGYIHKNLARHLLFSGQGKELAALLLDAGAILALKSDFHYLALCLEEWESSEEPEVHTVGSGKSFEQDLRAIQPSQGRISEKEQEVPVGRGFRQILKAVRLSWGRMSDEMRAFQFSVCGRLVSLRRSSAAVGAYLNSVESNTPKPYMAPLNSFFAAMESAQRMEIRVGNKCASVACSSCGRFIAAGVRNGIVVVEFDSGEVLQSMEGQTGSVNCVTFAAESKNIVSGCRDGKVVVWEWESAGSHVQVLEGHTAEVTVVAVSSDSGRIFSTSRDQTMRIWNAITGMQNVELSLNSSVNCAVLRGRFWSR